MFYKKLVYIGIFVITFLCGSINVKAQGSDWVSTIVEERGTSKQDVEECVSNVESLNKQLDKLYSNIADNIGIDKRYIKQLHLLAGGKAVYIDKRPNIYVEETSDLMSPPMEIDGAETVYQKAEFIECIDNTIERPSKYYLPDAVYSVVYDIKALMNQRLVCNRGTYQEYFDSLTEVSKNNMIFYESVLLYTGENVETVDKLLLTYSLVLTEKGANEYIIETTENGLSIKQKYKDIFISNSITSANSLKHLALMLSFDENLAIYDSTDNIISGNITPYIENYTSRENMMIAAMSLVGKVRYVWGGGHSGTSIINGINPTWSEWEALYADEPTSEVIESDEASNENTITISNDSFGRSIRPDSSWCPIHGEITSEFHGKTVLSPIDYIDIRKESFKSLDDNYDSYMNILSQIDFNSGVNAHLIDGLDCSGYTSWVYNQITEEYTFDTSAMNFNTQAGMKELEIGSELLPGDTFSWKTHIINIVGKLNDKNKVYVTVEQVPNVLRFGVAYYNGASQKDINEALKIASEASELVGGINTENERTPLYCMNTIGNYTNDTVEIDGETGEESITSTSENFTSIGRYKGNFIDDDIILEEYGVTFKELNAQQIIEHTLTKLPLSYVLGYNLYSGELFNKEIISSKLGVTLPSE